MIGPRSFFDAVAAFEPYNQHFLQDIGAFQVGLAAVLPLSAATKAQAVTVALLGGGVASAAHVASHVVGRELGGAPGTDIPVFVAVTVLLLAGAVVSWRDPERRP